MGANLPDPKRSRVLVIGAGRYRHLPALTQAAAGAADLYALLVEDPYAVFATGRHVRDPRDAQDIARSLADATREATDVLLVCYVGHGLQDEHGDLYLAVENTEPGEPDGTAFRYHDLCRRVTDSPARTKVVILDCCFSGSALTAMPGKLTDEVVVLASVPPHVEGHAPEHARYPAFTGDVIDVLRGVRTSAGTPEEPATVTIRSLFDEVKIRASRDGRPEPMRSGRGRNPEDLVLARGIAGSRGILIGTPGRADTNVRKLRDVLTDRRVGILEPEHCQTLRDPETEADLVDAVTNEAKEASGTLLVYFAGEAAVSSRGELLLATTSSNPGAFWPSGVPLSRLGSAVRQGDTRHRVVILDCLVHPSLAGHEIDPARLAAVADDGTCLIVSAAPPPAGADTGEGCTAFTGELVDILENGFPADPDQPPEVRLDDLAEALKRRLAARGLPAPQVWPGSNTGRLVLSRAHGPTTAAPPQPDAPPRPTLWEKTARFAEKAYPMVAAAVVVVLVALSAYRLAGGGLGIAGGQASCRPPLELRVLASPESSPAIQEAAAAFEDQAKEHGCHSYHLTVYPATVNTALQAFSQARQWAGVEPPACGKGGADATASGCFVPTRDVGPQPDAWFPDSSVDADRAGAAAGHSSPVTVERVASVARSPVVLGVPHAAAGAFGPQRRTVGWAALRDAAHNAGIGLVRPNPASSTTGLLATVGLYRTATGTANSTAAGTTKDAALEVEGSMEEAGYPLGDSDDLLCGIAQRPGPGVLVSEKALADYNAGKLPGTRCAGPGPSPDDRLVAYYPDGTPSLDHPLVRVRWSGQADTARRDDAVTRFGSWLRGDAGQRLLVRHGYRPAGGAVPAGSDSPPSTAEPTLADVRDVIDRYASAHRPGRVLFVLDLSWSMRDDDKLARAKALIGHALDLLGPGDAVGVMAGPRSPVDDRHAVILASLRSAPNPADPAAARQSVATVRAAVRDAVNGAQAVPNGVALYDLMGAALQALQGPGAVDRQAIVVVTDGEDTDDGNRNRSRLTPEALQNLERPGPRVQIHVVTLPPAACTSGGLDQIADATGGQCQSDATAGEAVTSAVASMWGGTSSG